MAIHVRVLFKLQLQILTRGVGGAQMGQVIVGCFIAHTAHLLIGDYALAREVFSRPWRRLVRFRSRFFRCEHVAFELEQLQTMMHPRRTWKHTRFTTLSSDQDIIIINRNHHHHALSKTQPSSMASTVIIIMPCRGPSRRVSRPT